PVQRPALGVAADQLVDPVEVRGDALDQDDGVVDVRRPGRLDPGQHLAQHVKDRGAAQVGLVQHVESPLTRLASCWYRGLRALGHQARPRSRPSRVSTLIFSPVEMNSGTATVAPVSTVAGLVPPVDRSPCNPGSVYVISSTTLVGSSTYSGTPSCVATVASASGSRYLAASPTVPAGTWVWWVDSRAMKQEDSPSAYRYCIVRLSTVAVSTLVPALNVLSTTLPDSTFFSVVRTNAPPLPGLTCWNSTTAHSSPSRLSTRPFLRSLVVAMSCLDR